MNTITISFDSTLIYIGLGIGVVTLLAMVILFIIQRKRYNDYVKKSIEETELKREKFEERRREAHLEFEKRSKKRKEDFNKAIEKYSTPWQEVFNSKDND